MSVPKLKDEQLYITFVGAIIERKEQEKAQILLQIREKIDDPKL